jgi:hypothetical protein
MIVFTKLDETFLTLLNSDMQLKCVTQGMMIVVQKLVK